MKNNRIIQIIIILLPSLLFAGSKVRLKDLTNIRGIRTNSLLGYGIVIGLTGTGDSSSSQTSKKAVAQMLTKLGMKSTPEEVVPGTL